MNRIFALMRKEYLETRFETFVFLVCGLICSFVPAFFDSTMIDNAKYYQELNALSYHVVGGFVAVWLNAVVLSACAFARERENGTTAILQRITIDWRVVAAGKFGYVVLSSLALACFFFLTTLGVDAYHRLPFLTTCGAFSRSDFGGDAMTFIFSFGLLHTWCWAVYWTSVVSRSVSAIFLSVFSSVVFGYLTAYFLTVFFRILDVEYLNHYGLIVNGFIGLALLICAMRRKFGYRIV